jgi:ribosomal protein S18 acetylase RimI-like enzyme
VGDTRPMVDIATAMQEAGTVRKARADEAAELAQTLARAFHEDPAMGWIFEDEAFRRERSPGNFELYLRRFWLEHDETFTTASVAGVCVWELPGKWKVSILRQLAALPALLRLDGRIAIRLLRAVTSLEAGHPDEPHYYLPMIGVDPDWQGRGLGSALLAPMLERCDREGVPAYLEASTPRNRELYKRHGFVVTEEFKLAKVGPPLWRMWRAPGA